MPWVAAAAITLPRTAGTIVLDGDASEAAWDNAVSFSLDWEISPLYMEPARWQTRGKLLHDGKTLYVFVHAIDSEPDRIQAQRGPHDSTSFDADYIELRVDPNASGQRAYALDVNAEGATSDSIVGGTSGDGAFDWTGNWKGMARRVADGYQIEYAVPLATVGITPRANGDINVAVNVERRIGRDRKEMLSWAKVDVRLPCALCQYERLTLAGVAASQADWKVTPYSVASSETHYDPVTRQRIGKTQSVVGGGADLLLVVPGGHRFLGTFNPDFSEVSPDSYQIEINRRFAVTGFEARPFYAEESGFYQSNMGLVDTWLLSDPSWAGQYTYRGGEGATWSAGSQFTHDRVTNIVVPSQVGSRLVHMNSPSDNLLTRVRYFPSDKLSLNGLVTYRTGPGYDNMVVAGDVSWQPDDKQRISAQLAASTTTNPLALQTEHGLAIHQDDVAMVASYDYAGEIYSASLFGSHYGKDFRADFGQASLVGVDSFTHSSSWLWKWKPEDLVSSASLYAYAGLDQFTTGDPSSRSYGLGGSVKLRGETTLGVSASRERQWYNGVPLDLKNFGLNASVAPRDGLTVSGNASYGTNVYYLDGTSNRAYSGSLSVNYKPGPLLAVYVATTVEQMEDGTHVVYRSGIANGAVTYTPSNEHRFRFGFNYRDTEVNGANTQNCAVQFLYAYRPGRFTWFYVGYDGNGNAFEGTNGLQRTRDYYFAKFTIGLDGPALLGSLGMGAMP